MIRIADYGLGNTAALINIYKRMNIECLAAQSAQDLLDASKIILPGVGSFDQAIGLLRNSGMLETIDHLVREKKVPLLGICVGMQMLAEASDEGALPGLGWISGRVRAFRNAVPDAALPMPHMGWNDVRPVAGNALFQGLEKDSQFYFLHSYFFQCERAGDVAATAEYGLEFACAVNAGNVYGVQFHPEKSHQCGARLLRNFAEH